MTVVQPSAGVFKVSIDTTATASTGVYTIELIFHEYFSTLTRTTTFVLTVSCVRTIDMLSFVPPVLYYINDPYIDVTIPLYTIGPVTCPYELTYSAALADANPLPNAITLQNNGLHFLRLYETDPLATDVYSVRVSVLDPKTSLTHTSLLIDVTVLCTKSIILLTNPIPSMTEYSINKSQLLTTTLGLPAYGPSPSNCAHGTWSYQVQLVPVGPIPAFITENPTTQIDVATTDAAKAGAYDFRIVVTDPLTSLQNSNISFHVDMLAITAVTLDALTSIPDQVYKVADPAIVLSVPRYLHTPSISDTKFIYSLVAPTPLFVSLLGTGDQTSQVQIVTGDHSMTALHTVTLQILEEYSQITNTFSF